MIQSSCFPLTHFYGAGRTADNNM